MVNGQPNRTLSINWEADIIIIINSCNNKLTAKASDVRLNGFSLQSLHVRYAVPIVAVLLLLLLLLLR